MEEAERHPPTHTSDQPSSTSAATQAGASPRTRQPRPTKTTDPARQQRQQQHIQIGIQTTERRSQLGAARAAAGLPAILENPLPSNPNSEQQLQGAELPHTEQEEPPNIPPARPHDDQFYDAEADDGDLELSGTQLSGSKEALKNPPEDERHS